LRDEGGEVKRGKNYEEGGGGFFRDAKKDREERV
jgi:hypothetical protein